MRSVAVVGSQAGVTKEQVYTVLDVHYPKDYVMVLGGNSGVDTYAEEWAKDNKVACQVYHPVKKFFNKNKSVTPLLNNVELITMSNTVIAIWNGTSKGTKFVIDYAKARDKKVEVFLQ